MKTRQRITNAQLHVEVVDLLRNMFLPSKKLIKEQIEWLIESHYIARDTTNMDYYVYLAWIRSPLALSTWGKKKKKVNTCCSFFFLPCVKHRSFIRSRNCFKRVTVWYSVVGVLSPVGWGYRKLRLRPSPGGFEKNSVGAWKTDCCECQSALFLCLFFVLGWSLKPFSQSIHFSFLKSVGYSFVCFLFVKFQKGKLVFFSWSLLSLLKTAEMLSFPLPDDEVKWSACCLSEQVEQITHLWGQISYSFTITFGSHSSTWTFHEIVSGLFLHCWECLREETLQWNTLKQKLRSSTFPRLWRWNCWERGRPLVLSSWVSPPSPDFSFDLRSGNILNEKKKRFHLEKRNEFNPIPVAVSQ